MSCERATAIDWAEFLGGGDPGTDPSFRNHYPGCPDCATEVRAWVELHAALSQSAAAHPDEASLLAYEASPDELPETSRQRVAAHLSSCAACREELATLRAFAPLPEPATRARAAGPSPWQRAGGVLRRVLVHPALGYALAGLLVIPLARDAWRGEPELGATPSSAEAPASPAAGSRGLSPEEVLTSGESPARERRARSAAPPVQPLPGAVRGPRTIQETAVDSQASSATPGRAAESSAQRPARGDGGAPPQLRSAPAAGPVVRTGGSDAPPPAAAPTQREPTEELAPESALRPAPDTTAARSRGAPAELTAPARPVTVPLRAGEPTSIALGTTWSPLILEIPLPRELERARAVSVSLTDAGDRRSLREQLPISPGVAGESPLISFRVPAGWLEPGSYTSEVSEPGGSPLARYELRVEPDEPR